MVNSKLSMQDYLLISTKINLCKYNTKLFRFSKFSISLPFFATQMAHLRIIHFRIFLPNLVWCDILCTTIGEITQPYWILNTRYWKFVLYLRLRYNLFNWYQFLASILKNHYFYCMKNLKNSLCNHFLRYVAILSYSLNIRINSATKFPKFLGKWKIISDVSKYDTSFRIPRIGWFRISFGQLPS